MFKLSFISHSAQAMNLPDILEVLEQLAPLSLAEPWDNVGLLVEPSKPRLVQKILLTNDLTVSVMEEAEVMSCDLIISYHPPLFKPFKRLVQKDWKQQLAIRAVEAGIAIYSPHTALDSVKGGINDWLIGGVGSGSVSVLRQAVSSGPLCHKLEFTVRNHEELETVLSELGDRGTGVTFSAARPDSHAYSVRVSCCDSALTSVVQTLWQHSTPQQSLSILPVSKQPLLGCGVGRRGTLDEPISIETAVNRMKAHLGLKHLRLALGAQKTLESTVTTVAVCAGSGGSVLQGVTADLYITGEMSHHEVLDAVAAGTSVILTDHSNSERGFLSVLRERLSVHLDDSVSVQLSQKDRDPLEVM
ncbi:NIF3-like protein 1-like [Scleropages formosus]|uniref:NIF3-like protein 1 n=1 Tax=Scleropages formosus TaxID=113540 RepID=A0A0P7XQ28_SCLFO|nr:NIF3-like protein 1-like [Scleropages formosus]